MRSFIPLLPLPLTLIPLVLGQGSPSCYWPDGSNADNMTSACDTSAENSACCGFEDICLSNGYCLQTTGPYANRIGRAGCTDPDFPSLYCPSYCTDIAESISTALFLAYETENGKFCCGQYNTSTALCNFHTKDTNGQPFDIDVGRVINDRSTGSTGPNATDTGGNVTQTVTATATATASGSGSDFGRKTTAIAAGIAVPLSVCLLAAAAAAVFLWRQNKKLKRKLEEQGQSLLQSQNGYHPDQHQMDGMGYPMGNYKNGEVQYVQPHSELAVSPPLAEPDSQPLAEVSGTPLNGNSMKR